LGLLPPHSVQVKTVFASLAIHPLSRATTPRMDWGVWWAFFAASWAISLSPGAGAVAAMSAGLQHGFARGYFLTFGLILGLWSQLALVSAGVGALIVASATAFAVVKGLGVAYLLWLGWMQWRAPAAGVQAGVVAREHSRWAIVARGWALNSVNPKGTLFMLAVVPQFLDPARSLLPQYLAIAATLAFTDLVVNAGYTAFAARALAALRTPRQVRWVNRSFGTLYIALATLLATVKRGA
jgi:homoserine/homoserine lactone efflux protein